MVDIISDRIRIGFMAFLVLIGYPLLLLCFTPIYLLRFVANFLKGWIRPDLGQLLPPGSNLFAIDEIWTNPKATIVHSFTLQGQLTLENLRSNFTNRILKSEKKNGACLHPELLQYPSTWLGFPVWVNEVNFSVEEHIKHYDGPVTFDIFNESAFHDVMGELTLRPFTPGKSIWEMYVFNDYHFEGDLEPDQPKSIMIIRIHHSMADGFSVAKLLDSIGDIDLKKWLPMRPHTKQSVIATCVKFFIFLCKVPYDYSKTLFFNSDPIGPWHLPPSKLGVKYGFGVSSKVSTNIVKKIRDRHQVTSTSVILAAVSGALRRIMLESEKPVPASVLLVSPTPMPGHPDQFTNHMTMSLYKLPVGTVSAAERLSSTEQWLNSVRKSTLPWFSFYNNVATGALYPFLVKFITSRYPISFAVANFVGPTPGSKFIGLPIIDSTTFQALFSFGMGCFIISTNENIRVVFALNEALLTDYCNSAKRFVDYVVREFDELLAEDCLIEKSNNYVVKKVN